MWATGWWARRYDGAHHVGQAAYPNVFDALRGTANGSDEGDRALGILMGPSWRGRYGDGAVGDDQMRWKAARFATSSKIPLPPIEQVPERVSFGALVPVWLAGLFTIVTIWCLGTYPGVPGRPAGCMKTARTPGVQGR